jgi:hypothetical protein
MKLVLARPAVLGAADRRAERAVSVARRSVVDIMDRIFDSANFEMFNLVIR